MEGDPQLFGAIPGPVTNYELVVTNPIRGNFGRIRLEMWLDNRRDAMSLVTSGLQADQMASTLGYYIPLIVKGHYVGTAMMRRHLWAVHNALGLSGRSVSLTGAGQRNRRLTP